MGHTWEHSDAAERPRSATFFLRFCYVSGRYVLHHVWQKRSGNVAATFRYVCAPFPLRPATFPTRGDHNVAGKGQGS